MLSMPLIIYGNYPDTIKAVYIHSSGDPSVGVQGESATITADGDHLYNLTMLEGADVPAAVARFRSDIEATFSSIWGEAATATFDFEIE